MRKLAIIILLIAVCASVLEAQQLLNGSFENNNAAQEAAYVVGSTTYYNCLYEINCEDFNNSMTHCTAWSTGFGNYYQCYFAILRHNCSFYFNYNAPIIFWGDSAAHGDWFIRLYGTKKYASNYEEGHLRENGLCLDFSEPLEVGTSYQLTYYIKDVPDYPYEDAGKAKNSYINIGLSLNDTSFGDWIGSSITPEDYDSNWVQQSLIFTANTAAKYLSLQIHTPTDTIEYQEGFSYISYTIQLDNFVLSKLSSLEEQEDSPTKLYPNPTSGDMFVESAKGHKVIVLDVLGRVLHTQEIYPNNKNLINLNHLEQGNYILHIKDKEGNQIEAKSFVKIR